MKLVILAVTKTYAGFCVAGMNENGKWIRPISRNSPGRFWARQELVVNGYFTKPGDVWEIDGHVPYRFEYPNHTEDFELTVRNIKPRLTEEQFIQFLKQHCEGRSELKDVFSANGKSLCLVEADTFEHYTTNFSGKRRARMIFSSKSLNFSNPHTNNGNIVVKDCKWESILLSEKTVPSKYDKIYVCIGLATPINNVEFPQVIGLHTMPYVSELQTYPD